jgi:hypothetical protein
MGDIYPPVIKAFRNGVIRRDRRAHPSVFAVSKRAMTEPSADPCAGWDTRGWSTGKIVMLVLALAAYA